ncbi:MAG: hypothetical protein II685_00310 [Clostridia bacterium]|nr:hypothetical protein [Clostridia bacterium]
MSVPTSSSSIYTHNLNTVKVYFRKPMALIISILSLVTLVLQFLVNSKATTAITDGMSEYFKQNNIAYTPEASSNVLSYLITGICIACFFMIYFSSATPNGNPSIFFAVLHALSVIELLLYAIASILIVVVGLISILSIDTVITYAVNNMEGFENINQEELSRQIESFRPTLFLALGIIVVILAIVLVYVNAQTAFLKSCKRSCKEPSLFYKGAKTFGNLSMVAALLQLVCIVIAYLALTSVETEMPVDFSNFSTPMLAASACGAITTLLKGSFCKKWEPYAKENDNSDYVAAAAAARSPEANPIATFKATTRRSNDAVKQSQPYLYGEEPNNDPNKKSSYIPEELQNDYQPQFDQNQGGMMGDPFRGDPFAQPPMQPMGGDPFAGDPFAQSPMGGNPYGQSPMDPNGGNPYNNGFM